MADAAIEKLKDECLLGARFIWKETRDLYGHVTHRLPDNSGFLLKFVRVGANPQVDPREVQIYDYDGKKIEGRGDPPAEWPIYTEVLKRRPDVNSVIHAHPHAAVAVSSTGRTLFALNHQTVDLGEGIPLFKGDMIDSVQIGAEMAELLGGHNAILLRGHGCVTVGANVPSAVTRLLYVEQAAQQLIWACSVGTPQVLPEYLREYHEKVGWVGGSLLWHQLAWEAQAGAWSNTDPGMQP